MYFENICNCISSIYICIYFQNIFFYNGASVLIKRLNFKNTRLKKGYIHGTILCGLKILKNHVEFYNIQTNLRNY